jgi:hypothetical protein
MDNRYDCVSQTNNACNSDKSSDKYAGSYDDTLSDLHAVSNDSKAYEHTTTTYKHTTTDKYASPSDANTE